MLKELEDYNWEQAFGHDGATADQPEPPIVTYEISLEPVKREDVVRIKHIQQGDHDGPPWLLVAKLKDKRWFFLRASCDYSGWG